MKYIMICLSIAFSINCFAQNAKIHGVVTYFFNDYQGNKPDLGAKVYVLDSLKCAKFSKDAAFNYDLASISKKPGTPEFDAIDSLNWINNNEILMSPDVLSTTVDGSGSYNIEVPPGTYYILFQSKGRNRETKSEILGSIYYTIERLKRGQSIDVSHNFRLGH